MWDLIVSVPDHCLSFYFEIQFDLFIEIWAGIATYGNQGNCRIKVFSLSARQYSIIILYEANN